MTDYLEALENYHEARSAYTVARNAYTGYSPDWALGNERRRYTTATEQLETTLRALIRAEVVMALEAGEGEG